MKPIRTSDPAADRGPEPGRQPESSAGDFARRIIRWQRVHGRNDLPWQGTRDAYRIWLSEIMLQQTQVGTVIPYYLRFLERFPDVRALAQAESDEVLALWSGLGYYSRARNLHAAARQVVERHDGVFPGRREDLEALPGVGRSTAAAIAVFSGGAREAILDGNVKRVLARHFAVSGFPGESAVERRLWMLAESLLPSEHVEAYTQGLMDLGATVCTRGRARCVDCPVTDSCAARAEDRVTEFPAPRPKKALPQREAALLLLEFEGRLLLQRRPPAGIWGGLWCLPQFDTVEEARVFAAAFASSAAELLGERELDPVAHGFTHYRLTLLPLHCRIARLRRELREPDLRWMSAPEALAASLPAPVRALVTRWQG